MESIKYILSIIKKNYLDKIDNVVNTNNDYMYSNKFGNECDSHFSSMGQHINNSFDNLYVDNNLIINNINSIYINEISELKIMNIINNMKSKYSKDNEGIDFKLFKLVKSHLYSNLYSVYLI